MQIFLVASEDNEAFLNLQSVQCLIVSSTLIFKKIIQINIKDSWNVCIYPNPPL